MTDKVQEIRKAIEESPWVAPHNALGWLRYLLTELDAAKQDKNEIQADIAVLKFAHKEEVRHLQRELDTAKQENADKEADNFILHGEVERLQQENERLKAMNPEFWDLYDRYEFKIAEKLKLQDKLKQAIHPIKEAHRLLELHRTAEAHATLTAAMNTIVEQVEKENTHEK